MNKSTINVPSAGTKADSITTAQNQHVSQPNANTNIVGSLFSQREIKFCGKSVDDGRWVYGYYDFDKILSEHFIRYFNGSYNKCVKVFPESVGQFIELYDRAGKEIFSNSILAPFGNITLKSNMDECFLVEYSKGCYNVGNESDTDYYIVGNLFDNPELLQSVA